MKRMVPPGFEYNIKKGGHESMTTPKAQACQPEYSAYETA